jgi:hypothetical protein
MEFAFKSNFVCDIGFNRCILVECKEGKEYIDFATVSGSDGVPCKVRNKSLRLPIYAWQNFTKALEEIEDSFSQLCLKEQVNLQLYLGASIYLSMTEGVLCVDLRIHYTDSNGNLKPGRPGIGFKIAEFQELLNLTNEINDRLEETAPEPDTTGSETPDISLLLNKDIPCTDNKSSSRNKTQRQ